MKIFILILVTLSSCSHWKGPDFSQYPVKEVAFKTCLVGDMGKGSPEQAVVQRALKEEKCHEIYFLGDIIYPDGLESPKDPYLHSRFFRYYRELTTQDHKPQLHIVLGNHDYHGDPEVWIKIAKLDATVYAPARYYFKRHQHACMVVFDSNLYRYQHREELKNSQEKWLKDLIPELKGCRTKVFLSHHPYRTPGPNHVSAEGPLKDFYEARVSPHFDYMFAGHEHIVKHMGKLNNSQLIISGAGGARASGHLPGYATLEWDQLNTAKPVLKLKRIKEDGKVIPEVFEDGSL